MVTGRMWEMLRLGEGLDVAMLQMAKTWRRAGCGDVANGEGLEVVQMCRMEVTAR